MRSLGLSRFLRFLWSRRFKIRLWRLNSIFSELSIFLEVGLLPPSSCKRTGIRRIWVWPRSGVAARLLGKYMWDIGKGWILSHLSESTWITDICSWNSIASKCCCKFNLEWSTFCLRLLLVLFSRLSCLFFKHIWNWFIYCVIFHIYRYFEIIFIF